MKTQKVKLGDVASFRKISVKPEAGTTYHCYSLPAFDDDKTPEILDGGEILSNKLLINGNDILVNKLNMRFKRIWRIDKLEQNSVCSTEFLPLVVNSDVNRDFVYYVLLSDEFTRELSGMRTGTSGSHQRVKPEWILDYEFALPPLATQTQIARILSAFDSKIEVNNKLNAKLEELADLLFAKFVGSKDNTWQSVSLLDIANYKNGLAMQKFRPDNGDVGLPVLKIKELGAGECDANSDRCRSDIDENVKIHDGDLVFSWSGTLLLDFWAGGDAGLNQHLFKVTSDEYPNWFYYEWTKHHLAKFISIAKDKATTMGHIKRSALGESEVFLPPKNVLCQQTQVIQPLIDQIIGNKIESRTLAALRDTLLPKLMRGELKPNT